MDYEEIKNISDADLPERLRTESVALHALKQKAYSKQLKQVHKIKAGRKAIARMLTVQAMRKTTKK